MTVTVAKNPYLTQQATQQLTQQLTQGQKKKQLQIIYYMTNEGGWIKIFRKFTSWQYYKDNNTKAVFLHLLLIANCEDEMLEDGTIIKRGQTMVSVRALADEIGLSYQQVRTALKKLVVTQQVTQQATQGAMLITICKYESYNGEKSLPNAASNAATNAAQREERKEERKEAKEIIKEIREITKKPRKQVYVSKKDELSLACAQNCDKKFYDWVKVNAPYITSHYTHLVSTPELQRLKEKYTTQQICDNVLNIENRQDLRKRYTNLYRTLINWLKRDGHGTSINNNTRQTAEQRKQEFAAEIMRMQQQDAANREKIRQYELFPGTL